jgi:hypothetical protein
VPIDQAIANTRLCIRLSTARRFISRSGVSAGRKSLFGLLNGPATPIFWNIDKSGEERLFGQHQCPFRGQSLPKSAVDATSALSLTATKRAQTESASLVQFSTLNEA